MKIGGGKLYLQIIDHLINRYCYFSDVMMDYPRSELVQQTFEKKNILLGIGRQGIAVGDIEWCLVTIAQNPVDANIFRRGGVNLFPLYRYKKETDQMSIVSDEQYEPNLNREIIDLLSQELNLKFNASDEIKIEGTFSPLNLLDYIYAVLHSTTYRNEYKEFLKIDFPRIPYPTNPKEFFNLVELGGKLRKLHLLESDETENYITQYPEPGCSDVDKPNFKLNESGDKGKVYINDTQYFDDVPKIAWDFYIGGYQPAQKWLKDRKGRQLDYEDIFHYQKIIVALCRTNEIMKEIDQTLNLIRMPKS